MMVQNDISIEIQEQALIINLRDIPHEDIKQKWLHDYLANWQLTIHEYEINADYHQASFYYNDVLYFVTMCDLTKSMWINATHNSASSLDDLYKYIS
ncbi:MAG: DUF3630 family protein [Glaciecola sp.]